jgi:ribosomal protein S3AE
MSTQKEKIIKKLYEILENKPNGIRYADLIREISEELPEVKVNTIHGTVWDFKQKNR